LERPTKKNYADSGISPTGKQRMNNDGNY